MESLMKYRNSNYIHRKMYTIIFILGLSGFLVAQGSSEATSVWKIKSSDNTVYLMGSIHLLKAEDFPPHPKMEEAYRDAQNIVFETNLDSMETMEIQQFTLMNAMYPTGQTLETELSDSVFTLAQETASGLGMDLSGLNQFKPWFVAVTLDVVKLQKLGFDPNYGIDRYFFKKAKEQGKNILSLESVKFQLSLFTNLDDKNQETFLLQSLNQFKDIEKYLNEILQSWKQGDLKGLENSLNKSFKEYPEMYEKFLVNRNNNWLQRIQTFLANDENYLVIVGAGHMAGEEGLINMLNKLGYQTSQL